MGRWYSGSSKSAAIAVAKENVQLAELIMDDPKKEAGWEFAESVRDQSVSIMTSLDSKPEYKEATEKQAKALEGMNKGLRRWFRGEELEKFDK